MKNCSNCKHFIDFMETEAGGACLKFMDPTAFNDYCEYHEIAVEIEEWIFGGWLIKDQNGGVLCDILFNSYEAAEDYYFVNF